MLQRGSPVSVQLGWTQVWLGSAHTYKWYRYEPCGWKWGEVRTFIEAFLLRYQHSNPRFTLGYFLVNLSWRLFYTWAEYTLFISRTFLRKRDRTKLTSLPSLLHKLRRVQKKHVYRTPIASFYDLTSFCSWLRACPLLHSFDQPRIVAYLSKRLAFQSYLLKPWCSAKTIFLVSYLKLQLFGWRSFKQIFNLVRSKLSLQAYPLLQSRIFLSTRGFQRFLLAGFFLRCSGRAHAKRSRVAQTRWLLVGNAARTSTTSFVDSCQLPITTRFGTVGITLGLIYQKCEGESPCLLGGNGETR